MSIEGRQIPVEGAWVVTAPPTYAPALKGVRTLYDLLFDLYVHQGWLAFSEKISFRDHVYPILQRLSRLQWVNKGFATQFGAGGLNNFEDDDYVQKLARKPPTGRFDTYAELRLQVFNSFRNPNGTDNNPLPWPWFYGDAADVPVPANSPRQNATISPTQYGYLMLWAAGHFEDDWGKKEKIPRKIVGRLLTVHGYRPDADLRGADAGTTRLDRFGEPGWLAVGDAAISFDPLSSQGILNALYMGMKAGQAIAHSLSGDPVLLDEYLQRVEEIYSAYRTTRTAYYAAEGRWRDRAFWRRRAK